MSRIRLHETYIFKISIKFYSFDVPIGIKITSFRVSVAVEPGHSLLRVRYHELFEICCDQDRIGKKPPFN